MKFVNVLNGVVRPFVLIFPKVFTFTFSLFHFYLFCLPLCGLVDSTRILLFSSLASVSKAFLKLFHPSRVIVVFAVSSLM